MVSAGVVDSCCEFGIVDVFQPVRGRGGVIQGVVGEDQETEGPDHGPSGHTARKQQEGRPGTVETNGQAAPRVESASHDTMNPRSPIDAALLKTM